MALNLDDIKDQVSHSLRQSWEQLQESSFFNQLKDQFENLSPIAQKLTSIGIIFLVFLIFFSLPWGSYSQSKDYVSEFETKRNIIRDLLKVSREASDNPDIPVPPSLDSARMLIDNSLKVAQLLPEQIKGIETISEQSKLIPANMSSGMLKVSLAKLNLRQIVDLGYQMQALNASLKVKDMSIEPNLQNQKYFDVVFKLIALNVPQEVFAPPEPPEEPKKANRNRN
jgi:hypothetical protein